MRAIRFEKFPKFRKKEMKYEKRNETRDTIRPVILPASKMVRFEILKEITQCWKNPRMDARYSLLVS